MATYTELRALFGEGALVNATEVAIIIKAHAIFAEPTPSEARLAWAELVLAQTRPEGEKFLKYALAAKRGESVEDIRNAVIADPPTVFQATVDAAVDKLYS